ncbi:MULTISPECIES: hypothetical protein [Actinomyces]|nr:MULTISPECIES: hypothetical protein [Actinomyces]
MAPIVVAAQVAQAGAPVVGPRDGGTDGWLCVHARADRVVAW